MTENRAESHLSDMFCQEASKADVREERTGWELQSEDSTEEVNCQSSFLRSREKYDLMVLGTQGVLFQVKSFLIGFPVDP